MDPIDIRELDLWAYRSIETGLLAVHVISEEIKEIYVSTKPMVLECLTGWFPGMREQVHLTKIKAFEAVEGILAWMENGEIFERLDTKNEVLKALIQLDEQRYEHYKDEVIAFEKIEKELLANSAREVNEEVK